MIFHSILSLVGNTPILELDGWFNSQNQKIFLKLENLNPGGSHKVRVALNIIDEAERKGIISRGSDDVLLAPTGGNTGIGLAMAAAVYGYRLVLVIPDNYSKAKQESLRLYGAEIVLSDSRRGNNSHGEKASELAALNSNYVLLDQQSDPANPAIHKITTAQEILRDFEDKPIDYLIGGVGTGGHISGVGEILKEKYPDIKIIGVQPQGCELLENKFVKHSIQGLSVGIIPKNLNSNLIDEMVSVNIYECKFMVYKMLRECGTSVGLSSGANLAAARIIMGRHPGRKINILTFAYDLAESYLDELTITTREDENTYVGCGMEDTVLG